MQEYEFQVPSSAELAVVDSAIEAACIAEGLQLGMKGSLARFPGSIHWHFKKPGERGTLEITSVPQANRVWAQVQSGRRADWIEPCLTQIRHRFAESLKQSAK